MYGQWDDIDNAPADDQERQDRDACDADMTEILPETDEDRCCGRYERYDLHKKPEEAFEDNGRRKRKAGRSKRYKVLKYLAAAAVFAAAVFVSYQAGSQGLGKEKPRAYLPSGSPRAGAAKDGACAKTAPEAGAGTDAAQNRSTAAGQMASSDETGAYQPLSYSGEAAASSEESFYYWGEAAIPHTDILYSEGFDYRGPVASVAKAAMPSVVAITTESIQEIQDYFGFFTERYRRSEGSGSGIIVGENDAELLIATNNHVVSGATTLSVCFIGDGTSGDLNLQDAVSAVIKGADKDNDLAIVAVNKAEIPEETLGNIRIASIGDSNDLVVGEQVVAIGNALGYGQSVTSGWVSALNRTMSTQDGTAENLIQTDAAINPGNSGGALLNMKGQLVGINSAKYASSSSTVEGMGYAISIDKARPILEELMNRKTRTIVRDNPASLGATVANLSFEAIFMYNLPRGAFITEIVPGGAADEAGLQQGDIILQMDGERITSREMLYEKMQYYEAGEEVVFRIQRTVNGIYRDMDISVCFGSAA